MQASIFGSDGHVTWFQECARAAVVFAYGLAVVRVAGRRVFGKWAALDIIVSVIVGSNLSRALSGQAALTGTLAATTFLMAMHWVLAQAAARSRWFAMMVEGTPIELGRNGSVDRSLLRRHSVSERDLDEALRQSSAEDVGNTRHIVLEPSGKITVLGIRRIGTQRFAGSGRWPESHCAVRSEGACAARSCAGSMRSSTPSRRTATCQTVAATCSTISA